MKRFPHIVATLLAVACLSVVATTDSSAVVLSDRDRADLVRVEAYLNSFQSMRARFVQMSSTGHIAEGDFALDKPGRMRIDYDPPVPMKIVSDGRFLIYDDTELEQQTHVPLSATPVAVLVDNNIRLNEGSIEVVQIDRGDATLEVSVVQREEPGAGEVRLVFSDQPLALRRWVVTDAQGIKTNFALIGSEIGVSLDDELFVVQPYERISPRDR